jgi:hypothetical protein
MKKQSRFHAGWDEKKVRRVLRHYESQTAAAEAAAEDAAAYKNRRESIVAVPVKLLPTVRKLLARRAG